MNLGGLAALSAGQAPPPPYTESAIGVSFLTPEQAAFNATRKKYGSIDDPDAGGFHLNQIDWNKDDGTTTVGTLDATNDGWMV